MMQNKLSEIFSSRAFARGSGHNGDNVVLDRAKFGYKNTDHKHLDKGTIWRAVKCGKFTYIWRYAARKYVNYIVSCDLLWAHPHSFTY